jgi:hypothetical protein
MIWSPCICNISDITLQYIVSCINFFVSVVKVPSLEEMQMPSVGSNWLKYLEKKRMQLLQLVSAEQFTVTHSYVKKNNPAPVELFPLYDVLEHRYWHEDK